MVKKVGDFLKAFLHTQFFDWREIVFQAKKTFWDIFESFVSEDLKKYKIVNREKS